MNKKSLDVLWSKLVIKRGNERCEYCGSTYSLAPHHIFGRINQTVRWDLNNGICLCLEHHTGGDFSAHRSPNEFKQWLIDTRGVEWYESLRKKSKQCFFGDYNLILSSLQRECKMVIM